MQAELVSIRDEAEDYDEYLGDVKPAKDMNVSDF